MKKAYELRLFLFSMTDDKMTSEEYYSSLSYSAAYFLPCLNSILTEV